MTLARSNPARKCEERETSRQFYFQLKEHLSHFSEEAADLSIENDEVPVLRLKLQVKYEPEEIFCQPYIITSV
jgi:hypothetical protein